MPDTYQNKAMAALAATGTVARATRSKAHTEFADWASQLAVDDIELARTAKRAMWKTVRHAGRPGAENERQAIVAELVDLMQQEQPVAVHREVLWMLSEIGGAEAVPTVSALLSNASAREDARMALERIPGPESLAALQSALNQVPADFQANIAQSLRARHVEVTDFPCQKLTPTKQTKVAQ